MCFTDVDECKLGTHKCHNNTRCINKIGWYYCECRNGFSADYDDELNELRCIGTRLNSFFFLMFQNHILIKN